MPRDSMSDLSDTPTPPIPNAERLTPEREKEIRDWVEAHGWRARLWLDSVACDLLRELDATRADRTTWRETAYADRAALDAVTRERDEARKVTDAMVERAARAMVEARGWEWDAIINDDLRSGYLVVARHALAAALGGGR